MAEIIYRIPSRTIQYGYVEIKFHADEFPDAAMDAAHYVNYVYAFQKEEQASVDRLAKGPSAPQGASEEAVEEKARELLDEGLGGVTELPEEDARDDVARAESAPWAQKVEPKAKPWEKKSTPTTSVGDDW